MISLQDKTPRHFREEILMCMIENRLIKDDIAEPAIDNYIVFLKTQFLAAGGDYDNPDYTSLMKVMKLLVARELRNGKSTGIIAKNFLAIANQIKARCGVC